MTEKTHLLQQICSTIRLFHSSNSMNYAYIRILTDRGTEYCGSRDQHEFQLYLALEDIDHSKTKSSQTNGICERFHRTIQDEFYAVAFRKKIYRSVEELQTDLNNWLTYYNTERTHTGKHCYGKTPMHTFLNSKPLAREKLLETLAEEQKILTFGTKQNFG